MTAAFTRLCSRSREGLKVEPDAALWFTEYPAGNIGRATT